MKHTKLLKFTVLFVTLVTMGAQAQTGNVVLVVQTRAGSAFNIVANDVNFGSIAVPATGSGTVTMSCTRAGASQAISGTGYSRTVNGSCGGLRITAVGNQSYKLAVSSATLTDGANTIIVEMRAYTEGGTHIQPGTRIQLDSAGDNFLVGGVVQMASPPAPGSYTGTYTVTITL